MSDNKRRILAFVIGCITVLFVLEIVLRLAGSVYQKWYEVESQPVDDGKANSVILCLGNSSTVGVGAPRGESYPDHLQRLFDADSAGKKVVVINKGVNFENTAELLNNLGQNIDTFKPELIILQTGQANFGNMSQYQDHLARMERKTSFIKRMLLTLREFVARASLYKLVILLTHDMDNLRNSDDIVANHCESYTEGVSELVTRVSVKDEVFFSDEENLNSAIKFLERATQSFPFCPNNYDLLGQIYLYKKEYEKALQWFIKAAEANPYRKQSIW